MHTWVTLHGGSESEDEAVANEGGLDAHALPGCHRAPRTLRHIPHLPRSDRSVNGLAREKSTAQGYLAHKKQHRPRTLQ